MKAKRTALIGLGTMGSGMARNLMSAGFEVIGHNRTRDRARELVEGGMRWADQPSEAAAGAEVVAVCLSDDAAVEAILFGAGVVEALEPGALLVDTGTTGIELTERMGEACAEKGVGFLDAPVTGSKLGAENGTLTFMVGGPADRVARARPWLEAMGRHVVHAGLRVGDGQRIKYCLNMTQAIVLEGILEGYALARAQGVTVDALAEVFEHSAGKTGVGTFKTPYLLQRDFSPHFRLDLMQKDIHLALGQASRQRLPLPLARAVSTVYDAASRRGWGAEDFLATAKLLELDAETDGRPG